MQFFTSILNHFAATPDVVTRMLAGMPASDLAPKLRHLLQGLLAAAERAATATIRGVQHESEANSNHRHVIALLEVFQQQLLLQAFHAQGSDLLPTLVAYSAAALRAAGRTLTAAMSEMNEGKQGDTVLAALSSTFVCTVLPLVATVLAFPSPELSCTAPDTFHADLCGGCDDSSEQASPGAEPSPHQRHNNNQQQATATMASPNQLAYAGLHLPFDQLPDLVAPLQSVVQLLERLLSHPAAVAADIAAPATRTEQVVQTVETDHPMRATRTDSHTVVDIPKASTLTLLFDPRCCLTPDAWVTVAWADTRLVYSGPQFPQQPLVVPRGAVTITTHAPPLQGVEDDCFGLRVLVVAAVEAQELASTDAGASHTEQLVDLQFALQASASAIASRLLAPHVTAELTQPPPPTTTTTESASAATASPPLPPASKTASPLGRASPQAAAVRLLRTTNSAERRALSLQWLKRNLFHRGLPVQQERTGHRVAHSFLDAVIAGRKQLQRGRSMGRMGRTAAAGGPLHPLTRRASKRGSMVAPTAASSPRGAGPGSVGLWAEYLQLCARKHSPRLFRSTAWTNAAANRSERAVFAALLWHKGLVAQASAHHRVFHQAWVEHIRTADCDCTKPIRDISTSSSAAAPQVCDNLDVPVPRDLLHTMVSARKLRRWLSTTKAAFGSCRGMYTALAKGVEDRCRLAMQLVPTEAAEPATAETPDAADTGSLQRSHHSMTSVVSGLSQSRHSDVSRQLLAYVTSHQVDVELIRTHLQTLRTAAQTHLAGLQLMTGLLSAAMRNTNTTAMYRVLTDLRAALTAYRSQAVAYNSMLTASGGGAAHDAADAAVLRHQVWHAVSPTLCVQTAAAAEEMLHKVVHLACSTPAAADPISSQLLALLPLTLFCASPLWECAARLDTGATPHEAKARAAATTYTAGTSERLRLVRRLMDAQQSADSTARTVDSAESASLDSPSLGGGHTDSSTDDDAVPSMPPRPSPRRAAQDTPAVAANGVAVVGDNTGGYVDITASVAVSASCNNSAAYRVLDDSHAAWESVPLPAHALAAGQRHYMDVRLPDEDQESFQLLEVIMCP